MASPPRIQIAAQMHDHVMHLTGIPARTFYRNAPTMVDAFASVAEYYGMDRFGAAGDAYNFEVEAMGAKMVYSDLAMPTIDFREPLIREPADLLKLKPPDFRRDGRLPYALECMRLSALRPMGMLRGYFCAPFSMAVGLRSYPALIKDMRKRPDFVRDLLSFIVDELNLPYLKAMNEYIGVTAASGFDAWAMVPNLSIEQLMEWVVPYNCRVSEGAKKLGMTATCGGGDYCEERPERFDAKLLHRAFDVQMASAGSPALFLGMGRWHEYPLEAVLDYTARFRDPGIRIPLSASINARLLRDGPVERIVDVVKRYIATFAGGHELGISIANIPADTASDHVHAAVAAVHTYGRKPIADDLDAIRFVPPHRESFQEWIAVRSGAKGRAGGG